MVLVKWLVGKNNKMVRDIRSAEKKNYDLIIIGGGFYGVMIAYESACRGLKTVLLEKNDFGAATSFNSLRIVHGGLRYLQSLDIHRFRESVGERKWFLENFPNLTKPISCLMPLYNKGLQRNSIMRVALNINDILSLDRNKSVSAKNILLNGKVISAEKVQEIFPKVDTSELKGGAIWHDGTIDDSQIVLMEILKTASKNGCTPLNYVEVNNIISDENRIKGVVSIDKETNKKLKFYAPQVINSTGPWSRTLARKFHKDFQVLFKYSIAWNALFDTDALSDHAIAITPPKNNAKTYFLRPWKGKIFAGTVHEKIDNVKEIPMPSDLSIDSFVADLNLSIPNLNLSRGHILKIFTGILPVKKEGSDSLAVREVIIDHSKHGGPKGLFSLSGVKLTTSRLVAEKVVNKIFGKEEIRSEIKFQISSKKEYGIFDLVGENTADNSEWRDILRKKIETESVVHLQDLILRRTSIGSDPVNAINQAENICKLFDWNEEKTKQEINDLKDYYIKRGLAKAFVN